MTIVNNIYIYIYIYIPIFMKGTKWIAGMNSGLSFWHDKWLNDGSSRNLIEGPFQRGEEDLLLKDVIHHRD